MSRLQKFCEDRGLSDLNQIHLEELMDFRDSWPTHSGATRNNVNRLRTFYRFCSELKWVDENLAKKLAYPAVQERWVTTWLPPEVYDRLVRLTVKQGKYCLCHGSTWLGTATDCGGGE